MGVQPFNNNGPHPLFGAGLQDAREKNKNKW